MYSFERKMATKDLGIEGCINNILEIASVALRTALGWLVQD
jgi:hypothetical protein